MSFDSLPQQEFFFSPPYGDREPTDGSFFRDEFAGA
jgi:hypothetical protein